MSQSKRREAWQHTSAILATLANINRDPKKRSRPFTSNDFNPLQQPAELKPVQTDIQILKQVFVDRIY